MRSSRAAEPPGSAEPPYRELILVSAPLAFSAFVMKLETLVAAAGLSRLPEPALALAAFVESPIISMLEGSIALVRDRQSFFAFGLFMGAAGLGLALVGSVLYFTPAVEWLLRHGFGLPPEVARAAGAAVRFLVLWPPLVGLRRFLQGLMVRFGRTKPIAWAVLARLGVVGAVFFLGPPVFRLPGAAEALLIGWWSRPAVRRALREDPPRGALPLTSGAILRFYLPLVWMQVLLNAAPPVITGGIGRAAQPELSLAVWPVVSSTLDLLGNPLSMLQQTVIAAGKAAYGRRVTFFTLGAGVLGSAALALLAFTPLFDWYLGGLLGLPTRLVDFARLPLRLLTVLPVLAALRALLRGRLITRRRTGPVGLAVTVYLVGLGVLLALEALFTAFPGTVAGTLAVLGATLLEVGFLGVSLGRSRLKPRGGLC